MKRTLHARLAAYIQLTSPDLAWDANQLLSLCLDPAGAPEAYRGVCWVWCGPMSLPAPKRYRRTMVANRKRYHVVQTMQPKPRLIYEGQRYNAVRLVFDTVRGHHFPPTHRLQPNHILKPDFKLCTVLNCVNPWHQKLIRQVDRKMGERAPSYGSASTTSDDLARAIREAPDLATAQAILAAHQAQIAPQPQLSEHDQRMADALRAQAMMESEGVEELIELLTDKYHSGLRPKSISAMREEMTTDFSLSDYVAALEELPELKDWDHLRP